MNTNDILEQNLKKLRKEKKYTQEALAGEAGVALSNYREMEHGKGNPTLETLDKVARFYGIDTSRLIGLEEGSE
jgi:transcriptional regulator with XRE-family HTH domain